MASTRVSFPADEQRHDWLGMLLDACAVIDDGVAEGIRREQRQGRQLACHRGCAACCRSHKTIPVYPLELVGLSWYVTEKVVEPVREKLRDRLRSHAEGEACPFLLDNVCRVHPLRPFACRQFNVFGQVCAEGEDAYYTRRSDVMTPIRRYTDDAFYTVLPFYGITQKAQRRKAATTGHLHQLAQVLQAQNWSTLADKMDAFDEHVQR